MPPPTPTLQGIPTELRLEIYKHLLPTGPIRLDTAFHSPPRYYYHTQQDLPIVFPTALLNAGYRYVYFQKTTFLVLKTPGYRNFMLEAGLDNFGRENVSAIRRLRVHLQGKGMSVTLELGAGPG